MKYQLPNGRTIDISIDAFLRMSDDDINRLNERHIGTCSNDPYDLSLDTIEIPEETSSDENNSDIEIEIE